MEFSFAKVTNSRLMGSMGLIVGWQDGVDIFNQYYLLDAEGLGIADYVGLANPTKEEAHREEERLMGGLGADRIKINKDEALFLINYYGNKNYYYEKDLPGNIDEYIDIIKRYNSDITIYDIFPKICKEIKDEVEFINYMTMRFIAWDKESLYYFSQSKEIAQMNITNINGTLLKARVQKRSNNKYVSEAIYEDNDGYYICKIAFNIEQVKGGFKINSMVVGEKEAMYDFDVFDEISKEEYVSIYSIDNCEDFLDKFYRDNPFVLKSDLEDAMFFTRFNFNNNHVKEQVYLISNDIKAIYYQIRDKFFVGTYSDKDRKYINKLLQCNYNEYINLEEEIYFDENVLYDFVESGSDDFDDFLS